MKRVFNFSGGKTSALMTILGKPTMDDLVVFSDTGREHPSTYKFIDDFEKFEGIKVNRLTYVSKKDPSLTGFDAMVFDKRFLANKMQRICTTELKINVTKRFLRQLLGMKFEQHIGFRADEIHRILKYRPTYKQSTTKFILNEMVINKAMVNQYWLTKPYTLEIPSILGNCDLCFLKGKNAIINILSKYPELADKWILDEEETSKKIGRSKAQYFKDISYRGLLNIAQSQQDLFSGIDINEINLAFSCSCTSF